MRGMRPWEGVWREVSEELVDGPGPHVTTRDRRSWASASSPAPRFFSPPWLCAAARRAAAASWRRCCILVGEGREEGDVLRRA